MNITVYLGSNPGKNPVYTEAVRDLGTWIGTNGHRLIYGGSNCGLMGELANAVLAAGGKVTGVEPQFFIDWGYDHPGITDLIVTENMSERKAKMIELGDAFLAFPGGTGTLEEITEIITLYSLGRITKPYVLYNVNGYYDALADFFDRMVEEGFVTEENRRKIRFASSLAGIASCLT